MIVGVMRVGWIEGDASTVITTRTIDVRVTQEVVEVEAWMLEAIVRLAMLNESLINLCAGISNMCMTIHGRRMKTLLQRAFCHILQVLVIQICRFVLHLGGLLMQRMIIRGQR